MSAYCCLLSLTDEILLVNDYMGKSKEKEIDEVEAFQKGMTNRSRVHWDNLTEMFIHHIWKFPIEWAYFNSVVTKARCRVCIQNTNGYSRFSIIICIFWIVFLFFFFIISFFIYHPSSSATLCCNAWIMMKTLVPIEIHCNGIEKLPSIKWKIYNTIDDGRCQSTREWTINEGKCCNFTFWNATNDCSRFKGKRQMKHKKTILFFILFPFKSYIFSVFSFLILLCIRQWMQPRILFLHFFFLVFYSDLISPLIIFNLLVCNEIIVTKTIM